MTMKINFKNNQAQAKTKSQAGFSLVELMVAMVIGLFLLGGVITMFISTKGSDRMRDAISDMDANGRTAIAALRESILHAGYPSIHNVPMDKAFFTETDTVLLTSPKCRGGVIDRDIALPGARQKTRDRNRGDVITVISLADNPCATGQANCQANVANQNDEAKVFYDCASNILDNSASRDSRSVACSADPVAGMNNTMDAKIYSTFRLGSGPNRRTLVCDGSRGGANQAIADNIEAMQILYGIQRDNGNAIYRNAAEVGTDWGLVTSVQIALLVRSANNILQQASDQTQYTLLDNSVTINDADRRRLFRVYTTTIHLANQNKGKLLQ